MWHKQRLGIAVTYLKMRGKIGLERVLFEAMRLDRCVRIKSQTP